MFKIHEEVGYIYAKKGYSYRVMDNKPGIYLKNSNYVFGYNHDGTPMNTLHGVYDYILAEYDSNGMFTINRWALKDEIYKL